MYLISSEAYINISEDKYRWGGYRRFLFEFAVNTNSIVGKQADKTALN